MAVAALVVTPLAGANAPAAAADDTIVLPLETQPQIKRPTLDGIKRAAANQRGTLEAAVEAYVAETAATSPTAWANQPDGRATIPDVMVDDLSAIELDDLAALARDTGTGFAETIDRHGWTSAYRKVAAELEEAFPQEFSGAVRAEDGSSAWFGFKDAIPEQAVALAKTLPAEVRLVGGRGFSEAELAAASENAHVAAMADPAVAGASTYYEIETGVIHVSAELRDAEMPTAEQAAVRDRLASARTVSTGMKVEVEVSSMPASVPQDDYLRGGGYLTGCTAGFNLKYVTTSTKRIGTAGHCGSTEFSTYKNHSADGGSTGVMEIWSHQGKWGDIGYYDTGGFTPTRTFYYDFSKKRYADSRSGMPAVGDTACKFGKISGRVCTSVRYRNVSVNSLRHMVVSNSTDCASGDSGGPWYHGGMAMGIHQGLIRKSGDTYRCSFTPAYLYQNRNYDVWQR
ncbi:S1 family peptidase [Nonomuraea sp. NPDC049129]|uniref:S1 family peptidase n=1 Tax=unclassified Nonomuraea TaxID=2593643 RepID=UPI0033C05919